MPAKTKPKLYRTLAEATPDIVAEYVGSTITTGKLYEKYRNLILAPFNINTLMVTLNRKGASQARKAAGLKMIRKANNNMMATPAQIRSLTQIARKTKETLELKAMEHTERMTAQIDKLYVSIDKEKVTRKNRSRLIADVDKWDQVARRTFQMDEREEITPAQFNLTVLTNLNPEMLSEGDSGMVMEAEPVEDPELLTETPVDAS